MEAFSDSFTQERQDSVNVSNDDLGQELCDNVFKKHLPQSLIVLPVLVDYRTWWYWAVYICPFFVIVVNKVVNK